MLSVVVYDISDTTSRFHLIKRLQYYGLKRIQKSVFAGYLELNDRLNLADEIEMYLSKDTDSIVIFPICGSCKESILLVGDADIPQNDLTYRLL